MHLRAFLGPDGLVNLLVFIDERYVPAARPAEVLEIVRRLHVPHYEEARRYWRRAEEGGYFEGANEVWPYTQGALTGLLKRYAAGDEA